MARVPMFAIVQGILAETNIERYCDNRNRRRKSQRVGASRTVLVVIVHAIVGSFRRVTSTGGYNLHAAAVL